MMKIYLMQHGRPIPEEEDPERPLSSQGIDDVKMMAGSLEKCGVRVQEILHSGKTRARQTAEIMMSRLQPGGELVEREDLAPIDDVRTIADYINRETRDLMIVGHLPHLAGLASLLVVGSDSVQVVSFRQGGVLCLARDEGGEWTVAWMLLPEII
ncbi:MAG: phosphohistidine phosphatase SixA [Deltaproteobacteria bacterium]|nr:phosphohistidine phosphatase SixA [Deltaproteobacteria bacterium]MBW1912208.1 phosphohistidine phosphatase SixA [Deltaproteobacteria bacterium]